MSLVCKCIPMSVRALEEYPGDPGRYWRNPGNLKFPGDTLGIQGIRLGSGGHCEYPEDPGIRVFLSIDGDPFFKILVPSLYITSTMYCSPRLCMFTLN